MKITDKNREQILDSYVEYILEDMDSKDLWELAYEYLKDNRSHMTNEDLESEILNKCPYILEE